MHFFYSVEVLSVIISCCNAYNCPKRGTGVKFHSATGELSSAVTLFTLTGNLTNNERWMKSVCSLLQTCSGSIFLQTCWLITSDVSCETRGVFPAWDSLSPSYIVAHIVFMHPHPTLPHPIHPFKNQSNVTAYEYSAASACACVFARLWVSHYHSTIIPLQERVEGCRAYWGRGKDSSGGGGIRGDWKGGSQGQ